MDSIIIKTVKKAAVSCAAAAIMITGSTLSAFAADPGLPGRDALEAGNNNLIGNKVVNTVSNDNVVNATKNTTSTNKVTLGKASLKSEAKVSNDTHPLGYQTTRLKVRWNKVSGAKNYQLAIKGGKYKKWTAFKLLSGSSSATTIKGLARNTSYQFKIRAVNGDSYGAFSAVQTLNTSRIDFNAAGWKAMCRIVYHEVGKSSDSCWDEPIVHVADCVINRYEAAKYLNDSLWAPYYKGYNSIQSMIYQSGGFMSDSGLANDGASYNNVSAKVKNAVYGSLYSKANINGIKHNTKIYYWQNTSYKPSGSKVAYVYPIPWGGYFSIWREYWG